MRSLIERLLRPRPRSKDDAKSRLKLILMHDQVDLTPTQLERMKTEIIEVISRYVEVDDSHVEFKLNRAEDGVQLVSSVPVRRVTARA
jgi:cell division topological specificity factor